VIPKDLESTRFYTHEAMQDLLEVVPNEKEILVILDSEDHELHDTLASMGFEVKSTESVTLLP
jgi:uroporphyrinogen-III synthase